MRSISNQEFCCKEWQSAGGVGWQELVRPAVVPGGHNRHVGQQPRQIAVRIQPTFFRRFNHAVDHGAALCAPRRVGEEKILPANHKGFYGTFGKVVAQLQPSVLQYTDQIRSRCCVYRSSGGSSANSCSIENSLLQYACPCKAAAFAWSFYGRDFTASSNLRRRCAQQPTTRMCSGNL